MGKIGHTNASLYPRIRTDDVLSVHRVPEQTKVGEGLGSARFGVRVQLLDEHFQVGEIVEVTFNLDDTPAAAVGKVIRGVGIAGIAQEITVEFLDVGGMTLAHLDKLRRAISR